MQRRRLRLYDLLEAAQHQVGGRGGTGTSSLMMSQPAAGGPARRPGNLNCGWHLELAALAAAAASVVTVPVTVPRRPLTLCFRGRRRAGHIIIIIIMMTR